MVGALLPYQIYHFAMTQFPDTHFWRKVYTTWR